MLGKSWTNLCGIFKVWKFFFMALWFSFMAQLRGRQFYKQLSCIFTEFYSIIYGVGGERELNFFWIWLQKLKLWWKVLEIDLKLSKGSFTCWVKRLSEKFIQSSQHSQVFQLDQKLPLEVCSVTKASTFMTTNSSSSLYQTKLFNPFTRFLIKLEAVFCLFRFVKFSQQQLNEQHTNINLYVPHKLISINFSQDF